ncbi:MAG TPA: S9 family peptidase [Pyrinomonadaceae bacterium]|nr:S9 family peptidase [Pyrinomonadaceae bacterium]
MKCRGLIGALFLVLAGVSYGAKVTVDDLMKLRFVADVSISPDGQHVAYVVSTPSIEKAEHVAILYVMPASGGKAVRMTYNTQVFNRPVPNPRLRWSPDGSLITFLGMVDRTPQVMAVSRAGGEAYALTSSDEGVTNYEWSPNGKQIAFLGPDPLSKEERDRQKSKSYVIHVHSSDRIPRLWVRDVEGPEAKAVSPSGQTVNSFNWSPDGQSIVFSSSARKGFYAFYDCQIYRVAASGGTPEQLVGRPGVNRAPAVSRDGKWIAFISTGGYNGMIAAQDLHLVSSDGRADSLRNLTQDREAWIGEFAWMPDSRSLLYVVNQQTQAREHMFEQPIDRIWLDSGKIENLTPGSVVNYNVTISRDGARLAYRAVEPRTMGDVVVMDVASRKTQTLTDVNPELRQMDLGEQKAISWKSFDGKEIWGLLITPPGYKGGSKLPLLVYCHGGPIGGFTYGIFPQFMHRPGQVDPYPVEAMASSGFALLLPMPRGGSGYGTAGFREIIGSWGDKDYKDIMAGVDHLIKLGIADPDRMGVMGASYGGFMTSWIVTQTDRFRAASTGASLNNLAMMYYTSDAGEIMNEYFGPLWDSSDLLRKHSALTFARNIKTPLLIQHGENDNRVPISQAWEFYRALRALNKTVEFDIYPRGGHVNYEPPLEREYMRRNLEWFSRWLKVETSPETQSSKEIR